MKTLYFKIFSLISAGLLAVVCFAGCGKDGGLIKTGSSGDFIYGVYSDHTEIISYNGSGGEVAVPSKLGGKVLTSLGDFSFRGTAVTEVILPDTLKSIGEEAFSNCTQLASVIVPKGVTEIRSGAFSYCSELTSVDMSAATGLAVVSENVFFKCARLASVLMSDSVETISNAAFYECVSL